MAQQVKSVKRAGMFIPGYTKVSLHQAPGRSLRGRHFPVTTIFRKTRHSAGFSELFILAVLVLFTIIGLTVYSVASRHQQRNAAPAAVPPSSTCVENPPVVKRSARIWV